MTLPATRRHEYPVTLRLDEADWRLLKERAFVWGIQPAVLARMLVRSYLRNLPTSLPSGSLEGSRWEYAPGTESAHKSR